MFSLEKELFIVKNFWPHRSNAKGFSIQNLARKYRLKISSSSEYSDESSNQIIDERNLKSIEEKVLNPNISIQRIHWANRDFIEYKKVA